MSMAELSGTVKSCRPEKIIVWVARHFHGAYAQLSVRTSTGRRKTTSIWRYRDLYVMLNYNLTRVGLWINSGNENCLRKKKQKISQNISICWKNTHQYLESWSKLDRSPLTFWSICEDTLILFSFLFSRFIYTWVTCVEHRMRDSITL